MTTGRDEALVDRAAAGAAFETVRRVELLLDHWGLHPPAALRSGGLGVRDLRATAARAARRRADGGAPDRDRPCRRPAVDRRGPRRRPGVDPHRRSSTRGPPGRSPSGGSSSSGPGWTPRGCRAWSAGATRRARSGTRSPPSSTGMHQVESRRMALAELAALPPGEVLASGTGVPSLVRRVRWLRPRRPAPATSRSAGPSTRPSVLGLVGARRADVLRPGPGRRRPAPPRSSAGRAAARAGRPRAAPGRPDRGRPRAAGVPAGPAAAAGRGRRVARRRDRLPVHPRLGAARPRHRGGRPWRCTSSSGRCRARRCRSR